MNADLAEFDELEELAELRKANARLQRQLHAAKAKTEDLVQAVRQGSRDAAVILGNPPAVPAPRPDKRRADPEVALLHLSDLHFGKQTDSFDSKIAAQRLEALAEKVVKITEIRRADHPITACHVLLGGDFVENVGIFPGQAWEVDSSLFTQLFTASRELEKLLRTLLASFQTVHVDEALGNHGRLGRKGDHPRRDNADAICYALTRERMGEEERLQWTPARSWYTIVEVGAYKALLVHGDQIKSFGGNLPSFGIYKKCNGWAAGVLPAFHDVYLGHFHRPDVIALAKGPSRAFINPSIESDSAYAAEFIAASGMPGQRLHFIDPVRGRITSEDVIWLD